MRHESVKINAAIRRGQHANCAGCWACWRVWPTAWSINRSIPRSNIAHPDMAISTWFLALKCGLAETAPHLIIWGVTYPIPPTFYHNVENGQFFHHNVKSCFLVSLLPSQQPLILPNVLILLRHEEPPTRRKPEIRQYERSPICQVLNVQRDEEIRVIRPLFATPDIPAASVSFRPYTKSINRAGTLPDIS